MSDKPECVSLKETARWLYIDSGRTPKFELNNFDVERLKLAQHWIGKLLAEQAERDRGKNDRSAA